MRSNDFSRIAVAVWLYVFKKAIQHLGVTKRECSHLNRILICRFHALRECSHHIGMDKQIETLQITLQLVPQERIRKTSSKQQTCGMPLNSRQAQHGKERMTMEAGFVGEFLSITNNLRDMSCFAWFS